MATRLGEPPDVVNLSHDGQVLPAQRGRERVSGVEVRGRQGTERIKLGALAFDGPGAPAFELSVQAGGVVEHDASAGYFPVVDSAGRVAERVYVAGGLSRGRVELARTLEAVRAELNS